MPNLVAKGEEQISVSLDTRIMSERNFEGCLQKSY